MPWKMIRVCSLFLFMLAVCTSENCVTNPCPVDNVTNQVPNGLVSSETIVTPIVSYICTKDKFMAKISCQTNDYMVKGPTHSDCDGTKWNPPLPEKCIEKPLPKDHKWEYIGGGLGGGAVLVIVVIVVVSVVCYRSKLRSEKKKEEMRRMKRFGSHTLGPNGEHLDGNRNMASIDLDLSLHKVWTCKRSRKKFFYADTLQELLAKAGSDLSCQGNVRLVMEEDGTQIDSDEALRACTGRVMLLLGDNEVWQPEVGLYDTHVNRLTFEVYSYDRKVRKLILADSIKDLKYQGSASLGYSVTSVCLEEDGTLIDTDRILCSCSAKTLMLLGAEHAWRGSPRGLISFPSSADISSPSSSSDQFEMGMFKVWTNDRKVKKVVFAENIVDLHIKASKALGLRTPIVVTLENDETHEITDDIDLMANNGKVLIIRENTAETTFNEPVYHEPNPSSMYHPRQSWSGHQNGVYGMHEAHPNSQYTLHQNQRFSMDQEMYDRFSSNASYRA